MNHPKTGDEELERLAVHTMPTHDIKEHEESILCWCKPKRDDIEPNLIIHNVFAESYGDERTLE